MNHLSSITLTCLVCLALPALAESNDDPWEQELDLDFSVKRKSTINDFPLKPIDSEDLSDAAIGGALITVQANESGEFAKPAYQVIDENTDKNLSATAALSDEEGTIERDGRVLDSVVIAPPPINFEQPIYTADTVRTLDNNYNTVER